MNNIEVCEQCSPSHRNDEQGPFKQLSIELNHKLSTPLGVALTALSSIDSTLTHNPKGIKLKELKSGLNLALKNLNKSIQYLSLFKQITQPMMSPPKTKIHIKTSIQQIIELMKVRYPHISAKVTITCQSDLCLLFCESVYQSIFENIIDNAFVHGFTDPKTHHELFINAIYDKVTKSYYFLIKDNGAGIPLAIKEKIFSPFYSANSDEQNVGIGLYEVEYLVTQLFNGKITIQSTNNHPGTVVKIVLPVDNDIISEQNVET